MPAEISGAECLQMIMIAIVVNQTVYLFKQLSRENATSSPRVGKRPSHGNDLSLKHKHFEYWLAKQQNNLKITSSPGCLKSYFVASRFFSPHTFFMISSRRTPRLTLVTYSWFLGRCTLSLKVLSKGWCPGAVYLGAGKVRSFGRTCKGHLVTGNKLPGTPYTRIC